MHDSYRNLVYGIALALMIGWVLYLGRGIIVPVVASILIVYIILGLARLLARLPVIGPHVPAPLRYLASILVIGVVVSAVVSLLITNINQVVAIAPQYQERLLGLIQQGAEAVGVETEPTWETIRRDVFGQIDIQSLIGSTVGWVSSIVGVFLLVLVYAGFLLAEHTAFESKIGRLSRDPEQVMRIREIIADINGRIGTYLALKTFINAVLGVISYAIMALIGIEFAGFWAALIALLNYIPYLGSFLGVTFPVALSLLQFGDYGMTFIVLAALASAQIFVGNFLEPMLLGSSLNLSPFVILVSLVSWYTLWGVAGALLAVPITAIIVIIFSQFDGTRPIAILLSKDGQVTPPPSRTGWSPAAPVAAHLTDANADGGRPLHVPARVP
ncbi:AI-2E family transporter [soil metagenome]